MKIIHIRARDLPEAWYLCLLRILKEGRVYTVSRGSYTGQQRLEFDFVVIHIEHPGSPPLVPVCLPDSVPPPTDMDYVERYLSYLISSESHPNEMYTYGQYLETQIPEVIRMFKEDGHDTNQAYMAVGGASSIFLSDPPCLRGIDCRIQDGKLHFIIYFRSWDLYGGFPSNLAVLQLLKSFMAEEIGVEDGEMIAMSKGLHLYSHSWEAARAYAAPSS